MPVYRLPEDEIIFPHPFLAQDDGLLAVGGDLSINRLLLAYSNGIFPWYNEDDPILWWFPHPRFVIFPEDIKISKSMKKILKKDLFKVTYDKCFKDVITLCGETRRYNEGTWITDEMLKAYCELHKRGYAHSVEVWNEDKLVGGLYGVSIGKCFFGESMFSNMSNASKVALISLAEDLKKKEFAFIDCQMYTKHLESMGAVHIEKEEFWKLLKENV